MAALYSSSEISYSAVPLASTSTSTSEPFFRSDGRAPLAYRDLELETSVADGTIGSAKVRIGGASDYTEVWAGVRGEIEECVLPQGDVSEESANGLGKVIVAVECAPTALPHVRSDLALHLSSLLETLFSASSLPTSLLSQLVVLPRSKAWTLYVDVLVLSASAGNVIDLSLLAARSALALTRVPTTQVVGLDDGADEKDGGGFKGLVKGGKGGSKAVDFELVDGGWEDGDRLQGWEDIPIALTLNLVHQLPHLDATLLEEAATSSQIIACFTSQGDLCGLSQLGEGEVELARVMPLLSEARKHALELMRAMNAKLKDA